MYSKNCSFTTDIDKGAFGVVSATTSSATSPSPGRFTGLSDNSPAFCTFFPCIVNELVVGLFVGLVVGLLG